MHKECPKAVFGKLWYCAGGGGGHPGGASEGGGGP